MVLLDHTKTMTFQGALTQSHFPILPLTLEVAILESTQVVAIQAESTGARYKQYFIKTLNFIQFLLVIWYYVCICVCTISCTAVVNILNCIKTVE